MSNKEIIHRLFDKPLNCLINGERVNPVKQSMSEMVDIQKMSDIYVNGGTPLYSGRALTYNSDNPLPSVKSLIESVDIVNECKDVFDGLPAKVKQHYGYDFVKFVDAFNRGDEFLYDQGVKVTPENQNVLNNLENKDNNAIVSTSTDLNLSPTGRGDSKNET